MFRNSYDTDVTVIAPQGRLFQVCLSFLIFFLSL